jgi:DNA-binding MarR family transcriptional regulator
MPRTRPNGDGTETILRHWQEAVPNDRLAHLIRDTARALVRSLQTRLAQHGVPFGHWAFLRILWETDGLTQRQLSNRAGVMEPTTFTAIKAMEKRGYVLRAQKPGNRRNVHIHLTPKGRLLKSKLVPLAEEVNAVAIRGIRPADVATTRRTLLAMIENLARDELEAAERQRRPAQTGAQVSKGKVRRRA